VIDAEIAGVGVLELLKKIKIEMPGASILITARPSPANKKLCAKVLEEGGFACMDKPIYASYAENLETVRKSMAKILYGKPASPVKTSAKNRKFKPGIVLIAASTGGPSALEKILSKLDADFPVPVLIVQHMTAHFIETLVHNLSGKSGLKIKVAENGEFASAGTAYIAPGGTHMKLGADTRIYFDGSPPINGVRPAADALFVSVAESFSGRILAVVLTGMGRDGEAGLARLKEMPVHSAERENERSLRNAPRGS
jgi:two-component system chemotaxis response regulator CheB